MLVENWLIFALDPKVKMDTETLFKIDVFGSSYIFINSFDFSTKQELCTKKFMLQFGQPKKSLLFKSA